MLENVLSSCDKRSEDCHPVGQNMRQAVVEKEEDSAFQCGTEYTES